MILAKFGFKDHTTGKSHRVFIKELSAWTRDGLSPVEIYLDGSYNKRGLKIKEDRVTIKDLNSSSVGGGSLALSFDYRPAGKARDFSVKPIPKDGIGIKGVGRLSISMGELAKPLELGGTLANPSLEVDPTQTAFLIGKALGGIALFGPLGIVAVLAGGNLGDKNPCIAAVEAIEKAWSRNQKNEEHALEARSREGGRKGTKESIKKVFKDIGRSIKSLFKK